MRRGPFLAGVLLALVLAGGWLLARAWHPGGATRMVVVGYTLGLGVAAALGYALFRRWRVEQSSLQERSRVAAAFAALEADLLASMRQLSERVEGLHGALVRGLLALLALLLLLIGVAQFVGPGR